MDEVHPLTAYRKRVGLKQDDIAAQFGVDKATVCRWEGGRITAERALEIEARIGIPRHELRPDLWAEPAEAA